MFDLIGAGLGLIGGLMGGDSEQTQTKQLDPRLANYVFGSDGKTGLLNDANSIYSQQMATGGLNDIQRQGLGMQQQYLMSPQYQQGNQSLYNMGMSMMGGGIAGNPFTSGQRQMPGGMQGGQGMQRQPMQRQPMQQNQMMPNLGMQQPSQGFQYQPVQMTPAPDYSVKPPVAQPFGDSDFERMLLAYLKRTQPYDYANQGSGDGFGGANGSDGSDGSDGPSGEA